MKGFNDLATLCPDIAKEAQGWDPSTVPRSSFKKMRWCCENGHTWLAHVFHRTRDNSGCPVCCSYGFNPQEAAWFYLLSRPGEQQFGLTNNLPQRLNEHAKHGWSIIETAGPFSGAVVADTESSLKKWLRKKYTLVPGKTENWFTSELEVHSLKELKDVSGIDTTIF